MSCEALSDPENGNISEYLKPQWVGDMAQEPFPNGEYPIDTRANHTCGPCYQLNGSETRTCQITGEWSSGTTTCEPGNKQNIKMN